jgi:hypothetical protein
MTGLITCLMRAVGVIMLGLVMFCFFYSIWWWLLK